MTYALDISFVKGDPKRFGGKQGGLRLSGDDPDDVLARLVVHVNSALDLIDEDESTCRLCALIDPEDATNHESHDHEEEWE